MLDTANWPRWLQEFVLDLVFWGMLIGILGGLIRWREGEKRQPLPPPKTPDQMRLEEMNRTFYYKVETFLMTLIYGVISIAVLIAFI